MSAADVVVVIPGILGSELYRDGRQTWGYRQIGLNLATLGQRLRKDLALTRSAFSDHSGGARDGTMAVDVLRTLGIIPGFWSIDGYDRLVDGLRRRYGIADVQVFPYDWRQSNRVSAIRLQSVIEPILQKRRETHPAAKLLLIGHSMGGLVARYYAACLDREDYTRRVITIGTPYEGSMRALSLLSTGVLTLGPFQLDLGDLPQSLPSVAELLPVYPCIRDGDGNLRGIGSASLPGVPGALVAHCLAFHREMDEALAARQDGGPAQHAIVGHLQPTDLWASVEAGRVVLHRSSDPADGGDGTVPRRSASPPEWSSDASSTFLPGMHSSIHQRPETLRQLHGIITARPRVPMAAEDEISVSAMPHATPHDQWHVSVQSCHGTPSLALELSIEDDRSAPVCPPIPFRPAGAGRYVATWDDVRPGAHRWTVRPIVDGATPVQAISDVVLSTAEVS